MAPISLLRLSTRQCLSRISQKHHVYTSTSVRTFTQTPLTRYPRKGSQDKDSIDRTATEYSKTGSDDSTAQMDAAFDPSNTDPQAEKNDSEGSELDVSPANPDVSKQRGQTEGGAENSPSEGKRSGGGGQKKNKEI